MRWEKQGTIMGKLISAVIITKNEEKILGSCLKAIQWVDEIIVVDCGSIDRTVKIAKKYGAKVRYKKWQGYAAQKNYALSKTRGEWVLCIDADEIVTDTLQHEILSVLHKGTDKDAFDIPLKNFFYGRWLKHGGLSPDRHVKLCRKKSGSYPQCEIHESLQVKGEIGHLKNHLLHHTKENISVHVEVINNYTDLEMKSRIAGDYMPTGYSLFIRPLYRFIKYYLFKLGFLDGLQGLIFHILTSMYLFLQEAKIVEKRGFRVNLLWTMFKRAR
jgi:glycosyltransferase involved in cell wall biosynthesis